MKHFDVEANAKQILGGYSLKPNESTWPKLLDKLHETEQKNRKRRCYIKGATFLVFLMLGIGLTKEGIGNQVGGPFVDKLYNLTNNETEILQFAQKREVRKEKAVLLMKAPNDQKVSPQVHGRVARAKKKTAILSDTNAESPDVEINRATTNTSSESRNLEVTEEEIDDLMRKARQNIEKQKALQAMRKLLAVEILAEIEQEIEYQQHRKSLSQNLKNGFVKLKDVIAN